MAESNLVEWDDRYSVGVKVIDEQHQSLVKIANELFKGCTQGEEEAKAYFGTAIKQAVDYVRYHFATEEKLLMEAGYPDFPAHKKKHETFVRTVIEEVKAFQEGRKFVPNHFARYLRDWILEHIAVEDRLYRDHLAARGYK